MLRSLSPAVNRALGKEYVSCVSIARETPREFFYVDESVSFKRILNLARQPGMALIWQGDFATGKEVYARLAATQKTKPEITKEERKSKTALELLDLQRQHRKRTADVRHALLLPMDKRDFRISLVNAPDVGLICSEALQGFDCTRDLLHTPPERMLISFRDLQEMESAHAIRQRGIPIKELKDMKIYPHFGVFWPARADYRYLAQTAPLQEYHKDLAIDVGTGTGCLALILAHRGVKRVLATDIDERAVKCAKDNIDRFGMTDRIQVEQCDLFPANFAKRASLVVFNPPWIPGEASSLAERAIFDTRDSQTLRSFLQELPNKLTDDGIAWLLISDFAELVGLRKHGELESLFARERIRVVERLEVAATHPRALEMSSKTDLLLKLRKQEKVSLWCLAKEPR